MVARVPLTFLAIFVANHLDRRPPLNITIRFTQENILTLVMSVAMATWGLWWLRWLNTCQTNSSYHQGLNSWLTARTLTLAYSNYTALIVNTKQTTSNSIRDTWQCTALRNPSYVQCVVTPPAMLATCRVTSENVIKVQFSSVSSWQGEAGEIYRVSL